LIPANAVVTFFAYSFQVESLNTLPAFLVISSRLSVIPSAENSLNVSDTASTWSGNIKVESTNSPRYDKKMEGERND